METKKYRKECTNILLLTIIIAVVLRTFDGRKNAKDVVCPFDQPEVDKESFVQKVWGNQPYSEIKYVTYSSRAEKEWLDNTMLNLEETRVVIIRKSKLTT